MEVTDRKRWNRTLLEILQYYINICEENNLTYFLAYGTAIGAARHHGIIPWDDDIDVIMPRPDYERFQQICQHRDMGKYELMTPKNTSDYYLPFIKLCDKTTTLWEKCYYHCVIGIFIDIFVIDGAQNDPQETKAISKKINKYHRMLDLSNSYYTLSDLFHMYICKKRIRVIFQYLKYALNRKKYSQLAIKEIEKLEKRYDYNLCEFVTNGYSKRVVYPKAWLEDKIMMPFETLQVAMPCEYKRWLNLSYGDYTQLPPEDQRHYEHSIAYYDFDRRMSLDEILAEMKQNKTH